MVTPSMFRLELWMWRDELTCDRQQWCLESQTQHHELRSNLSVLIQTIHSCISNSRIGLTQTLSIPQYLLHFIENLWSQVNKMQSVNNGHSGFIHKCSVLTETKVYYLCLAFSKRSCILPVASSTLTWICLRENRYLHNFSDSSFGGLLCVQPAEQHGLKENVPPHGLGSQSFNTGLIEMCIIYICA